MPFPPGQEIDYAREAAEIAQMKEDCERLIHEAFVKIDELLEKIDGVLRTENAATILQPDSALLPGYSRNLSLDELNVLIHGTQKLEP